MKTEVVKESKIELNVGLDENHIPVTMNWQASDGGGQGACKAVLLAMWDEQTENTMRIDLWDKEMSVYDMQRFFHQTLATMAETFERATGQKEVASEIRDFAGKFARKTGIL